MKNPIYFTHKVPIFCQKLYFLLILIIVSCHFVIQHAIIHSIIYNNATDISAPLLHFFQINQKTRNCPHLHTYRFEKRNSSTSFDGVSGSQMGWAGRGCKTLRSGRSLASSRGFQIMDCQDSGDHGWKVSTAASDAEQERVLHPACPCIWLPLTLTPLPASFVPKEVLKKCPQKATMK